MLIVDTMRYYSGLIHVLSNVLQTHFPDDMDSFLHRWALTTPATVGVGYWLSDATGDVHPVGCHSHNDYWRTVPLFDALSAGCPSVEADIWYQYDDLCVGHRHFQLDTNRTLRSMYINPLMDILEQRNSIFPCDLGQDCGSRPPADQPLAGVFSSEPDQPLVLLIDFKTQDQSIWQELQKQLQPLRDRNLLAYFNGTAIVSAPLIIIGTGLAPFDELTKNDTYRDVFYDAPLELLADTSAIWPNPNRDHAGTLGAYGESVDRESQHDNAGLGRLQSVSASSTETSHSYDYSNSYYASVSFKQAIGHVWGSRLTPDQLQLIRAQVRGAHRLGLKARYWDVPAWPIGLRNHIWHILIREGADVLSVDDLRQATTWDWRKKKGLLF